MGAFGPKKSCPLRVWGGKKNYLDLIQHLLSVKVAVSNV